VALSKYVYNPKKYPDFSWNWLGRFLFFFGLTLNTSFMAFFLASRLNIPVNEIGGTVATFGGVGILERSAESSSAGSCRTSCIAGRASFSAPACCSDSARSSW